MSEAHILAEKPGHVPQELVVDYDFYLKPHAETEFQVKVARQLHAGPDVIWTPRNGGHWVFTRADDIDFAQKDAVLFSMREVTLPAGTTPMSVYPLESDEPEHTQYRGILQPNFNPGAILAMEDDIRALARELIQGFYARGECEFVTDFAAVLPIVIFMNLADLPDSDRQDLIRWAEAGIRPETPEQKAWGYGNMIAYIEALMKTRAGSSANDIVSRVLRGQVSGRAMSHDETRSIILNALLGGLDTVTSTMSFLASYLARHPDRQRELVASPELIPRAVEELLRYHGATATARVVVSDFEHKGILFKAGDRVLIQALVHGLDERRFPDPETVDFNRRDIRHATFGQGPHKCIGALLARVELKVFIEEWLKHIPSFGIKDGDFQLVEAGMVNSVARLPLAWAVSPMKECA